MSTSCAQQHRPRYYDSNHAGFIADLEKAGLDAVQINLVDMAYDFAKSGHRGQTRKDQVRYFEHVRSVCLILLNECGIRDERVLCAAVMHDLVEDTWLFGSNAVPGRDNREVAAWRLARIFDKATADAVLALSKIPKDEDPAREAEAHKLYLKGLELAGEIAWLVKMADRLHNLRCLSGTEPAFIAKQLKETKEEYLPLFEQFAAKASHWPDAAALLLKKIKEELNAFDSQDLGTVSLFPASLPPAD